MEDKNTEMAVRTASAIRQAGGRTYYVGGFVRDQFLKRENKDIDIEMNVSGGERYTMIKAD